MLSKRLPRVATLTLGLLVGLTACGGGAAGTSSDTTPGVDTTTPAETTAPTETSTTEAPEETSTSAATDSGEVVISHAQGETPVPVNPETVVVFEYAALDTLEAIGANVTGVVKGTLPPSLQEYAGDEYVDVGTLFEPDYEAINALDPDLIIAGGRSSTAYANLAEIAPTIDMSYDWVDFSGSFVANTTALGRIFDAEEEVAARLADIESRVEEISDAAAAAGNALIVMTSAGEVTAFGPGSRFGLIHDVLGVAPAIEDVEAATHGDAVSFEFILEADPGILYVVDRDAAIGEPGAAAAQVLDNELVHQTRAWQKDSVVYLDSPSWYLVYGGLTSVERMLAEVESSLE